jgi:hypothetical protein
MRYAYFRKNGFFASSGVSEAASETVVGRRFKHSGMKWSVPELYKAAALRYQLLSASETYYLVNGAYFFSSPTSLTYPSMGVDFFRLYFFR